VLERLRPQLVSFRDDRGTELFDLADAPRPDAAVTAPVRLLGEFDNVLLGHADRRRIVPEGLPWEALRKGGRAVGSLLLDGMVRATWWIERVGAGPATLAVRPWGELSAGERDDVAAEAERALAFAAADADVRDVRFEAVVT
jgi:hypothetical protein